MKIKMKDGSIQEAGFDEKLGKDAFTTPAQYVGRLSARRF